MQSFDAFMPVPTAATTCCTVYSKLRQGWVVAVGRLLLKGGLGSFGGREVDTKRMGLMTGKLKL